MSDKASIVDEMEDLLDEVLHKGLKEGVILTQRNGDVILGEDGQPLRGEPNAAFLNIVVQRLKGRKPKEEDRQDAFRNALGKVGGRVPDVDVEGEDPIGRGS